MNDEKYGTIERKKETRCAMLLRAEGIEKNFGIRQLLGCVDFYLDASEKVGLIGQNGTGKSTLLKILAGEEAPDAGTVVRSSGVRVSYLPQEMQFRAEAGILSQVLEALGPAEWAAKEHQAADHDEHSDHKTGNRCGAASWLKFFGCKSKNAGAKYQSYNFRGAEKACGIGDCPAASVGGADPGRADQPSGSRNGRVAGGLAAPVYGKPRHGHARSVFPGTRHGADRRAVPR